MLHRSTTSAKSICYRMQRAERTAGILGKVKGGVGYLGRKRKNIKVRGVLDEREYKGSLTLVLYAPRIFGLTSVVTIVPFG